MADGAGVADGVPVGADGVQVGAQDGDPVGDLAGDGVAQVGVGVDRPTSWPPDSMAEAVLFAVLSPVRGVRAGCWSIVAGSGDD